MDENPVLVEKREGYRVITLNRPQRLNAFNEPMQQALVAAVADAEQDENCRALLLTGTGRAFSSGPGSERADQCRGRSHRAGRGARAILQSAGPQNFARCPFPVVCAVNGTAAGVSCNIALACDIVLAARSATFLQPFARLGIVPDGGGTWLLPRLVGQARARGLALLAEPLSAEKAEEWGLIWKAVDDAEPDGGGRKALRAFLDRADVRPGPDQARARRRRGQRSVGATRPRAQSAARGRLASELPRRRAGLPAEAQAELFRQA